MVSPPPQYQKPSPNNLPRKSAPSALHRQCAAWTLRQGRLGVGAHYDIIKGQENHVQREGVIKQHCDPVDLSDPDGERRMKAAGLVGCLFQTASRVQRRETR